MALRDKIRGLFGGRRQQARGDDEQAMAKSGQIVTRPYRRRDREAVLRIAAESFRGVCIDESIEKQFGPIGDTWQEHKKQTVDYDLVNNPMGAFVAEAGGKVIGFVCTRLQRYRLTGHVANLAVVAEFQGMGVGKALMAASLEYFRESGMLYARIETLEQNVKARSFYPALGFKEVARQIYYFTEL